MKIRLYVLMGAALLFAACSSSGGNGNNDGGTDGLDGTDDGGDTVPPKQLVWSNRVVVDDEQAGLQLSLAAMPDGQNFAIAYFKHTDDKGTCETPILGGPPTDVILDKVRYAWSSSPENWQHEEVDTVANMFITGISLAFQGNTPRVAYLGGTPLGGLQICGGTDTIVASRQGPGSWNNNPAAALSNEASAGGDCPKMQSICDFGDVVGLWSTLAASSDGRLGVVWRDIHNGYDKESDDSSDLEFAETSGGGWTKEWVDLARGAGSFPSLVYGADGQPAVAYYLGKSGTINFAKRPWRDWTLSKKCSSDADCDYGQKCSSGECLCLTDDQCPAPRKCVRDRCSAVIAQLEGGLPDKSISMAVGKDGRYLVAYFDVDARNLVIAHSTDGENWIKGIIDSDGNTGMYPSLVVDPLTGQPGVAYYRCSDYNPNLLKCERAQDGLRYAAFSGNYPAELTQTAKWKKYDVSRVSEAMDGMFASAAVLPDGRVGVAYLHSWYDQAAGITRLVLSFKLGTWQ